MSNVSITGMGGVLRVSGLTLPYALALVRHVVWVNRHRQATSRMVARSARFWWQMHGGDRG